MGTQLPGWIRPVAHCQALFGLFVEKLFANAVIVVAILVFIGFMRGTVPSWQNALAVIVGYLGAFMVNFYLQFGRYHDANPNLKSDHAGNYQDLTAALREEYRVMASRKP